MTVSWAESATGTLVNLFVMLGFATLGGIMRQWLIGRRRVISAIETGALFGVMATVAMLIPIARDSGLIFDCRTGVIGAGALLNGPLAAGVSMVFPIVYRVYLGGDGVFPGVLEIVFPALLGAFCCVWFRRRQIAVSIPRGLVCSAFVGFGTTLTLLVIMLFTDPVQLQALGVPFILAVIFNAPISMAILSTLFILERQHFRAVQAMAESERRMLHSQKMAALGQLARKIAHAFANALVTITGSAYIVREQNLNTAKIHELMGGIIATTERLSFLTGELLSFSNSDAINMRRMDLSKSILGVREIITRAVGSDIKVVMKVAPDAGMVLMDRERIEQVILHLAVNAAEAMSNRGQLTLTIAPARLSRRDRDRLQAGIMKKDRHRGRFAMLSVSDTGCGMTPETCARIFEPFFTTKQDRQNAGLGLASVYNIVQQHRGCIDVHSRLGHGSTFCVYLPVIEDDEVEANDSET